jgi:hypothetical protein
MISDDLHSPLVDSADESGLLHFTNVRVGKHLTPICGSRLMRVDVWNIVELSRAFIVDVPSELRELREESSLDQRIRT